MRSRNLVKGALIRHMESTSHRLYRIARNVMLTGEVETFEDRLAALDAVTEDDVMRVAEDIMDPKGLNVVMFGNDVKDMEGFSVDQLDF